MKDSLRASTERQHSEPPKPPTDRTRKTREDQVLEAAEHVAQGVTKTYQENPEYEVPY